MEIKTYNLKRKLFTGSFEFVKCSLKFIIDLLSSYYIYRFILCENALFRRNMTEILCLIFKK